MLPKTYINFMEFKCMALKAGTLIPHEILILHVIFVEFRGEVIFNSK